MRRYLQQSTSAAPLAVFRMAFGVLIFVSMVRFWLKGWINELYIQPRLHFPFFGFEFVKALGPYTYLLFAICALASVMVALGWFYRASVAAMFLSFTYIELIDKSTYLNHYYFVSLVCVLLFFLPAHTYYSVDSYCDEKLRSSLIPRWTLDALKIFVSIIYFYAGLAKLNSDWLFNALPLRIWLPAKDNVWLIGPLFSYEWVAYAFSWFGCIYDLSIPFLLLNKSTRPFAYGTVVVFHLLTAILFPIGMFPYIMMITALIFFSPEFHEAILRKLKAILKLSNRAIESSQTFVFSPMARRLTIGVVAGFLLINVLFPFRYLLYPGELFWTEEGYRFSWRVMLMEKAGTAEFKVTSADGRHVLVNNRDFLTPLQEKMMATQPDMILQYAHILRDHFTQEGFVSPKVFVTTHVALNGRLGKPLIDPTVDLASQEDSFQHKTWILSFNDEIKGL